MQHQLTKPHIHEEDNSPMLRQGIVHNVNRGYKKREGEERRGSPRKGVEEEGRKAGGVERDANPAKFEGTH